MIITPPFPSFSFPFPSMSTSPLSFPVVLKFSFSTRTNYRETNSVLDKDMSASGFVVKTRNGVFSTVPSWVNYELAKMNTYSLNDAECYSVCSFHELRDKSKTWRAGTDLMDILGANNKVLPSIKAAGPAGRKRLLSAVSEMDAAEEEDDSADSDYMPSDADEADDDHEFDENVVSEPEEDNEPGTEPEDDVLTDGDYESDPEENLRFIARKAVARAKAKRSAPPKPASSSMKRTDLMTSSEFQQRIGTLVARIAKRAVSEGQAATGLMAPRRSAQCSSRNVCTRNRAPYNSPMLRAAPATTLNAEDMLVVEALLNLKNGNQAHSGPRMEIHEMPLELPPAATVPRRSTRIANKNSH